ncbi:type II secretion system protein GspD [Neosynechococcus sphagnicola]|uniref:type II secretion system protein GspD n=1 Tax=Neosynechococcus sphagnicola TaxID=1501145 RepID=UPI000691734D|nr:hypothetical protein [Neosynechococcus sphagnicola]
MTAFFVNDGGTAVLNFGGTTPPTATTTTSSVVSPPVIANPYVNGQPFISPFASGTLPSQGTPPLGEGGNPLAPGVTSFSPGSTTFAAGSSTPIVTPSSVTFGLPSFFQYPTRFLSQLQAQVQSGNAKILTDPTLTVQEGQTAVVNLTQEVFGGFQIRQETTATGSIGTSLQSREPIIKQAGLTLSIKVDRIDDNGFVSLSVAPTVSAPSGSQITPDGVITLLSQRSLTSGQIRLRDNQTLILSGIIQESDRVAVSKVPILGDIPLLGALFRQTSKTNQRQEVIVLLTPQVVDDSDRATFGYGYTPSPNANRIIQRDRVLNPSRP